MKALEKLTVTELREHIAMAKRLLAEREQNAKSDLKKQLLILAKEAGFSFDDLVGHGTRSAKVKFQHPNDPSLTWSGRGRRPKWLAGQIDIEKYKLDQEDVAMDNDHAGQTEAK